MIGNDSDSSWKKIGQLDPYYGVLTLDKYRKVNLHEQIIEDFFRSGDDHINSLLSLIEKRFGVIPHGRALDFGCGVGRLAIPLAARANFKEVIGADISEGMLIEARQNALARGLVNIDFVITDDALNQLPGTFDFIHSFIVFQHIPIGRGESIIMRLIDKLSSGGIAVLQMPLVRKSSPVRRFFSFARANIGIVNAFFNLTHGKPLAEPLMQMNLYNANKIIEILYKSGIASTSLEIFEEGGNLGVYFIIQR